MSREPCLSFHTEEGNTETLTRSSGRAGGVCRIVGIVSQDRPVCFVRELPTQVSHRGAVSSELIQFPGEHKGQTVSVPQRIGGRQLE